LAQHSSYGQGSYNGGYGPGVKVVRTIVHHEQSPYDVYPSSSDTCQCHQGGFDMLTSHQSSTSGIQMGPSSHYGPMIQPMAPVNHEFDRVLLNPPTAGCSKPQMPSTPKMFPGSSSYSNTSSSCNKGCDSAQFVLESVPCNRY